ncbi:eukaryotic translation initiation factor 4B3-like [Vigna umbellata]|uniref:eukaryotic translation initiation factor 4B3-like n=1 Tax=Vigna umbellata TaxID=87088 RepID=UPI001F5F4337|nr:eukaryotic translation initiation factor 4B3-like [Vigna umbellata]
MELQNRKFNNCAVKVPTICGVICGFTVYTIFFFPYDLHHQTHSPRVLHFSRAKKSLLRSLVSLVGCSLRPPPCRHSSSTTGASIVSGEVLSKLGDPSNSRWGSSRVSDVSRRNGSFGARDSNCELPPSRADETYNWTATKKPSGGFERKERDRGGFFDSQSRVDESECWVSNKSFVSSERRFASNDGGFERERKRNVIGFGSSGGADSND